MVGRMMDKQQQTTKLRMVYHRISSSGLWPVYLKHIFTVFEQCQWVMLIFFTSFNSNTQYPPWPI